MGNSRGRKTVTRVTGYRKNITPATQAALWTLSNGRCYAPGCTFPVVFEIRPGVYRKNAQTVGELRQVIEVMSTTSTGLDGQTAALLAEAAEVYGNPSFHESAVRLADAVDFLPSQQLSDKISQLQEVADMLSAMPRGIC